jgi:hypothetical protein
MDMPHHLRTLPPEALDILRYFHTLKAPSAHAEQIIEGAGLSDRGFGKAIRRLVTKNYLVMDGEQVYRLSDNGKRVVAELNNYDENAPEEEETPEPTEPRLVTRHLVLVTPRVLQVGQPSNVFVGFDDADDDEVVTAPLEIMLRLSVVHGEPDETKETSLIVENRAAHQVFEVTAGQFTELRIRVVVCQLQDGEAEQENCNGLYADLPVGVGEVDSSLTAVGTNLLLREALPSEAEVDSDELDFE